MITCKNRDTFPSEFFNQPWIIQCHGGNKPTTTFVDPWTTNGEEREVAEMKGKLCMGCIDEWLLLRDIQSKECCFLDLNSRAEVRLPRLPSEEDIVTTFSLSSSPDDPKCIIIFTGGKLDDETHEIAECFIMCCRLQDEKWTKVSLDVNNQNITGATSVVFNGKLYAYSVKDLITFDVPLLLIGQLETRTIAGPELPIQPRTDMVSVHLIESCGNIYLARMYSYGMGPIINMDIYRLDLMSDEWSRVRSIGTQAFFLSYMCYTSVPALEAEVSGNCIYYVPVSGEGSRRRIYKFCLDDHTMTFQLTSIEQTDYESRICWFVPKRSRGTTSDSSVLSTIVSKEATDHYEVIEERIAIDISVPWEDLPSDLLEALVPRLSLVDAIRLSVVCKTWNFISDSVSSAKITPWLMYQAKLDGTFKLLDPLNGDEFSISIGTHLSTSSTQMLSSKDGWVIMLCDDRTLLIVNPMTKDVVKLPALEDIDQGFHGITFTSVPTSPDCVVTGIYTDGRDNSVEFYVWHVGEEEWTVIYDEEVPFSIANTNPVFLDGDLYCLGELGQLGVFNPVDKTWEMLEKPDPLYLEEHVDAPFRGTEDCYLLEMGGELVSVFKHNYSDYELRIFRLDKLKMQWTRVGDIPGWTIFLDQKSSSARPSPHGSWSNKVLFTTIHSGTGTGTGTGTTKTCAAYCMKTKRYEVEFCDTTKPLDCVWFEPNLISEEN